MHGILLLSYGALQSIDDLLPFYTHIFHGQRPSEQVMDVAAKRFRHFHTADPLATVTARQAQALTNKLQQHFHTPIHVYTAMKHTPPFIEDTIQQMIADGITTIVAFPMSPLFSRTGTIFYKQQIEKAINKFNPKLSLVFITHWHLHNGLIEAIATRLQAALQWISAQNRSHTIVLFTAHSQPGAEKANADYIASFQQMSGAIAKRLDITDWKLAYRSATPNQKWLEPDLLHVMDEAKRDGYQAVVVCDLLSLTENIEVLFDCRIDGGEQAAKLELEFVTTEFLNDSSDFIEVLEEIIMDHIYIES